MFQASVSQNKQNKKQTCISYSAVALIKYHDKTYTMEERVCVYCSRELRPSQQESTAISSSYSSRRRKLKFQLFNKHEVQKANCQWAPGLKLSKPTPVMYFLQQADPLKPPQTAPAPGDQGALAYGGHFSVKPLTLQNQTTKRET